MPDKVICPKCNRKQPQTSAGIYWCQSCQMYFDSDPDEGSDYSDRNPTARLEREERERERKLGRIGKRK